MSKPTYMTIAQAAARWGVTKQRVHQWIVAGRVPSIKIGSITLIPTTAKRPKPIAPGPKASK